MRLLTIETGEQADQPGYFVTAPTSLPPDAPVVRLLNWQDQLRAGLRPRPYHFDLLEEPNNSALSPRSNARARRADDERSGEEERRVRDPAGDGPGPDGLGGLHGKVTRKRGSYDELLRATGLQHYPSPF